ncbi:MAG: hypothetical protein AC479_07450 [miscellaneous Crenarchaeota group-6 archaeon AD8-1]|nr:MAG: hypothetical protein AC479_07450 [miscellaneous Crenarchaeota group-6 archaeon AD8-1]
MDYVQVAIVGAGPAGSHCASELGKMGIYPLIFDPSHPREKPCGGGISPIILEKFPFIEKFREKGVTFKTFRIISCTGIIGKLNQYKNGFSISRKYFDNELLKIAIKNGAKLKKEKVINIQKKRNSWNIKTSKGLTTAKIVVGADGVNSIVRRKTIGPMTKDNLGLTFGYLLSSYEKIQPTIKYLALIPGYIWVFPWENCCNIGIGSEIKYGGKLRPLLNKFIKNNLAKTTIISKYAAMIPSAKNPNFFDLPCSGDDWILIGDAAGHVDPISGGGILYALWGGKMAAKAIKNNQFKKFDKNWRKAYGDRLKQQCRRKEKFYDPIYSTLSIINSKLKDTKN